MKPISFYHQLEVLNFDDAELICPIQLLWCQVVRMLVSPSVMMVHFLGVVFQYQELEENLNSLAVDFVIVVTSMMVLAVQAIQQRELVVNQIQFECHTTFPNLHFFFLKKIEETM